MRDDDTARVVVDTNTTEWQAGESAGHHVMPLFEAPDERVTLEKLDEGTTIPAAEAEGGDEIFVLAGSFQDEHGSYAKGTWIRNPAGTRHAIESPEGCMLWIKRGHLPRG